MQSSQAECVTIAPTPNKSPRPEGPGGRGGRDECRTAAEGDHVRMSSTTERRTAKSISATNPLRHASSDRYRAELAPRRQSALAGLHQSVPGRIHQKCWKRQE